MFPFSSLVARTKSFMYVSLFLSVGLSFVSSANNSGEAQYEKCVACHGMAGEGVESLNAPAISGQDSKYIIRQLESYRVGIRGKAEQAHPMAAIAKTLTKANIDVLATYIQTMPIVEGNSKNSVEGNLKNGSRYYQAKCGACHGGQAQGNKVFNTPRLANQSSKYLLQQMQDFVAGKRGYDKKDKFGRQMAMMANTTEGEELSDILFYIAKQGIKQDVDSNLKAK